MNIFLLTFRQLAERRLATILNVLLVAFGTAILSLILQSSQQVQDSMERNAQGIDAVVGAKGSPLQLVLSSVYHADIPNGNFPYSEALSIAGHEAVEVTLPISLGDQLGGFRIVGTAPSVLEFFDLSLARGAHWDQPMQAVIGAQAAQAQQLRLGDHFSGSHGLTDGGPAHGDQTYQVVGILEPTGSVTDRLIFTDLESVAIVHAGHSHSARPGAAPDAHSGHYDEVYEHHHPAAGDDYAADREDYHQQEDDGQHHDEGDAHAHTESQDHHEEQDDQGGHRGSEDHDEHAGHGRAEAHASDAHGAFEPEEITALLVRYKGALGALQFPRYVNQETSALAASPAEQVTRLFVLLGGGLDVMVGLGIAVVLIGGFSIFIALYGASLQRQGDHALMRAMGARRHLLVTECLLEGVILGALGGLLGLAIAHAVLLLFPLLVGELQGFQLQAFDFSLQDALILITTLTLGMVCALLPAWQAYRLDVVNLLGRK